MLFASLYTRSHRWCWWDVVACTYATHSWFVFIEIISRKCMRARNRNFIHSENIFDMFVGVRSCENTVQSRTERSYIVSKRQRRRRRRRHILTKPRNIRSLARWWGCSWHWWWRLNQPPAEAATSTTATAEKSQRGVRHTASSINSSIPSINSPSLKIA